jgi:hypothetical protein
LRLYGSRIVAHQRDRASLLSYLASTDASKAPETLWRLPFLSVSRSSGVELSEFFGASGHLVSKANVPAERMPSHPMSASPAIVT